MREKSIKINLLNIAPLLIVPFIEPPYFSSIDFVDSLYGCARFLAILILIYLFALKKCLPRFLFIFSSQYLAYIIATSLSPYDGNYSIAISYSMICIGLFMALSYNILYIFDNMCEFLFWYFTIVMIIEFLTVILCPTGIYNTSEAIYYKRYYWFLGHQNITILFVYPTLFFSYICIRKTKSLFKRAIGVSSMIISVATVVLTWSATSIVGLAVCAVCFLYGIVNKQNRLVTMKTGLLASTCVFFFIILFRRQYYIEALLFALKRDVTFTSRTKVWDAALVLIKNRFLLGYGQNDYIWKYIIPIGNAHNKILQLLINGGVLYLFLFIIVMICISKRVDSARKNNKQAMLLISICVSLLIQMQIEVYVSAIFWMPFIISYYVAEIPTNMEV